MEDIGGLFWTVADNGMGLRGAKAPRSYKRS